MTRLDVADIAAHVIVDAALICVTPRRAVIDIVA